MREVYASVKLAKVRRTIFLTYNHSGNIKVIVTITVKITIIIIIISVTVMYV
jgi:hypothetical protein